MNQSVNPNFEFDQTAIIINTNVLANRCYEDQEVLHDLTHFQFIASTSY
jgi:hypothetical protein